MSLRTRACIDAATALPVSQLSGRAGGPGEWKATWQNELGDMIKNILGNIQIPQGMRIVWEQNDYTYPPTATNHHNISLKSWI